MEVQQRYTTTVFAVFAALLFIWIGFTGRLGSLLGAFIAPGYMMQGISPSNNTNTNSTSNTDLTPDQEKQVQKSTGGIAPDKNGNCLTGYTNMGGVCIPNSVLGQI